MITPGSAPETLFPLKRRKGGKNTETPSSFSHLLAKTVLNYLFIGSLIWLQFFLRNHWLGKVVFIQSVMMLRHSICFQSPFVSRPIPTRSSAVAAPSWVGEGDAFGKGKRQQMSVKTPWTRRGAWRWLSFYCVRCRSGAAWPVTSFTCESHSWEGKAGLLLISCESQQLWYFSFKLVTVEKV